MKYYLLCLLVLWQPTAMGFAFSSRNTGGVRDSATLMKISKQPQEEKQSTTMAGNEDDDEGPAGIGGAEFFGGSKEKTEYFDADAEANADKDLQKGTSMNRFFSREDQPTAAFDSVFVAQLAQSLQRQINSVVYGSKTTTKDEEDSRYSNSLQWNTPLAKTTSSPWEELTQALKFYSQVDLAVVSGKQISSSASTVELQWELSLVWPTFWAPRVLLVGSSTLQLDGNTIVSQSDQLINGDVLNSIGSQVTPRFWDWYHIGMTPSAEQMPRLASSKKNKKISVYEIPSRWVTAPSIIEVGGRDDRNAQTVPNHAFSCIIKTMGPTRQSFVPTTPVQIQLMNSSDGLKLKWSIPLSVQFQTQSELPLAGKDLEMLEGSNPECSYEFQPRRKVATVPYGGNAQDKDITDIRKKLYDQVLQDGFKPKLDESGKPFFFFLQNTIKACYTREGLGMCVYEWRPKSVKPNEVGIELELS